MNRWTGNAVTLCFSAALLAGCFNADPEETDDLDESAEAEEFVTSTTIEIGEDGEAHVVGVEQISREEMRRQIEERYDELERRAAAEKDGVGFAEQAISLDSGCGGSSLWMYDQPFDASGNNSGHRLCVKGPNAGGDWGGSYAYVCRTSIPMLGGGRYCTSRWGGAVRAYWAGTDMGYFWNTTNACGGPYGVELFDSWDRTNAGACAQASSAVYFGSFVY